MAENKQNIHMDNTNFIFFQLCRDNENLLVRLLLLSLDGLEIK